MKKRPLPPKTKPPKYTNTCKKGCDLVCDSTPCRLLICLCDGFASLSDPGYVSVYEWNGNSKK